MAAMKSTSMSTVNPKIYCVVNPYPNKGVWTDPRPLSSPELWNRQRSSNTL